jgi:hypothetical protein
MRTPGSSERQVPTDSPADLTAVLSSWRRPQLLTEQVEALRRQSSPPAEIWVWADSCPENAGFDYESLGVERIFRNSSNLGVYGRFAIALMARTRHVGIFDDDTMPGCRYLESGLQTVRERRGIVAAAGVQFTTASYRPAVRYGWARQTATVSEVDVGCNSWMLEREWLNYLWREPAFDWFNGEDMRLSYLAQKYGGIRTYTPPQGTPDLSGSVRGALGRDAVALSGREDHYRRRSEQLVEQLENGWQTVRGVRL